jgi:hypothetical protein
MNAGRAEWVANDEPPPVSVITQRAGGISHTYTLINERPYRNRHGHETRILIWSGTCRVCGEPFSVTSPPKPSRYMTRTCPKHWGQR